MGEASSRIERHIAAERDRLDRDLQLIERKVETKVSSLRKNTAILAGISVAAGILLSLIASRWMRG